MKYKSKYKTIIKSLILFGFGLGMGFFFSILAIFAAIDPEQFIINIIEKKYEHIIYFVHYSAITIFVTTLSFLILLCYEYKNLDKQDLLG